MNDIILYHGSKQGIQGQIQPNSHSRCDFGKGFYMGTDKMHVKARIYREENPVIYTLNLKISEIPKDRILRLSGKDWLMSILYHRKHLEDIQHTDFYKQIKALNRNKDLIIGSIADDRINEAINAFIDISITDECLLEYLKHVDSGTQYVTKTNFACSKIEIVSQETLDMKKRIQCNEIRKELRKQHYETIQRININYRRKGKIFDELLKSKS